jgi:putative addiction module component (TIGR02574 family)
MPLPATLVESALALPAAEREDLMTRLLISLHNEPAEEGYDEAWAKEINDRIERYERGETTAIDWHEAIERVRQSLRERVAR